MADQLFRHSLKWLDNLETIIFFQMQSGNFDQSTFDKTKQSQPLSTSSFPQPSSSQAPISMADAQVFSSSDDEPQAEPIQDQSASSQNSDLSMMSDGQDYGLIEDEEEVGQEDLDADEVENVRLQMDDEEMDFVARDQEDGEGKNKQAKIAKGDKMKLNLRNFQATLIESSRDRNSIIYLPTGTGKTRISICSMYYYLCKYGTTKKIVFLANTIQLVKQQAEAIKQTLTAIIENEAFAKDLRQKLGGNYIQLNWTQKDINNHVVCIHGQKSDDPTVTRKKRIQAMLTSKKQFINQMKKATITVMISQMFLNCLRRGYIKLTDYSFAVFDECHHCGGDHPYAGIMKEFYFEQKKKMRENQKKNQHRDQDLRLPILMGLTASPVSQPYNDYQKLSKELKKLAINLDSNYSYYPFGDQITNKTQILLQNIKQPEQKELIPDLMDYFDRYKDHATSLAKIKIHFPLYHQCIKKVIDIMSSMHQCLKVDVQGSKIVDPQLYLLYDIKECLLLKLRDLWLELGEFAFCLGFHQMNTQLSRLTGLRNQENTKLLEKVKVVLKHYGHQFKVKYGKCQRQFMSSKLLRLIDILKPQSQEDIDQDKVSDMVLVFAFKRRTVKYLQMVLQKYKEDLPEKEKKFYTSVGVTGYANSQKSYRLQDGHSYQSNPSAQEDSYEISKLYSTFVQKERQQMQNRITLQNSFMQTSENQTLKSQMNRMFYSKMGKMLLQVQQKYHNQIKKIVQFKKKQHRVLITTSVTEEGFDIPGCNLVISFDTPFGMKSYIQIKGRARKKNSKYIIFTNEKFYKKMEQNKKIYDNTIHAIYQLAINNISKQEIDGCETYNASYERVPTKGGALLNTNYSLQLLKSYFTSLKQPNKPYFHFIQTSNICYKCIIKFPQSSTCSRSYVVGKPQPRKQDAQKSAAFVAIKVLKKEGFIRDDLRPSRLEELQDEMELEKYDDLGLYHKDNSYRAILDQYVMIEEGVDDHTHKKLIRFYYKSLEPQKLQFPHLNREFDQKKFQMPNSQPFPFQIYLVKFSNTINTHLLAEDDSVNQIGILTCFEKEETQEMFARFRQHLDSTCQEEFQLRLVEKNLRITRAEYEKLKVVHNFLWAGAKSNELEYYSQLNNQPPLLAPMWINSEKHKKSHYKIDFSRQFFPLMVLLKRPKDHKQSKSTYIIDQLLNRKIQDHIALFSQIFILHNKPAKYLPTTPFAQPLQQNYKLLFDTLQNQDPHSRKYLVQCITQQMCFNKGVISTRLVQYNKNIQIEEENKKKNKLKNKWDRLRRTFTHFKEESSIYKEWVTKVNIWRTASKEDLNEILNKQLKSKKVQDEKGMYRFLKEFVLYPVLYPTMLRVSLISKYVFPVIEDHSIALYFRKYYLLSIFSQSKTKLKTRDAALQPYKFSYYKSVLLDNSQKIFGYMQNSSRFHVRQLGRLLVGGGILNFSSLKNDISSINYENANSSMSIEEGENNTSMSMMKNENSKILNASLIRSKIEEPSIAEYNDMKKNKKQHNKSNSKQKPLRFNADVLNNLRIQDILRALTSKTYKHQKSQNYEQFQFIGDVVLKYLATLQIFLQKTDCQQGQMHISRANIICNANLHRATIRRKLFEFIFTNKGRVQPAPIVVVGKNEGLTMKEEKKTYDKTDIPILGRDDDDAGYQYIPGKVHADVMEALIGIFYLKNKNLNDCQTLLYAFGILSQPTLQIDFRTQKQKLYTLPAHLQNIEAKLNYTFVHKQLLIQALTHPSFLTYIEDACDNEQSFSKLFNKSMSREQSSQILNLSLLADKTTEEISPIRKHQTFYERMEFLGDAFLDLLVVEFLYDQGGDYLDDQGTLSFLKQSAVSNKTLGFIALKENLQEYLFIDLEQVDQTMKQFRKISKEMDHLPSPLKFSKLKIGSLKILGDVFQSLIGAILIDNCFNYDSTKTIVMGFMKKYIKHFTNISFVSQCPSYKYKQYLDENNYKKYRLVKVIEEGIVNGDYMYQLTDKNGNAIGEGVRAPNDKDAWDVLLDQKE